MKNLPLSKAWEGLETALPYMQGKGIIAEDGYGDPLYEEEELIPRLIEPNRNISLNWKVVR